MAAAESSESSEDETLPVAQLRIVRPAGRGATDLTLPLCARVALVKVKLEDELGVPEADQRLIYGGKVLADAQTLEDIVGTKEGRQTFHLVVPPPPPAPAPPPVDLDASPEAQAPAPATPPRPAAVVPATPPRQRRHRRRRRRRRARLLPSQRRLQDSNNRRRSPSRPQLGPTPRPCATRASERHHGTRRGNLWKTRDERSRLHSRPSSNSRNRSPTSGTTSGTTSSWIGR